MREVILVFKSELDAKEVFDRISQKTQISVDFGYRESIIPLSKSSKETYRIEFGKSDTKRKELKF